MFILTGSTVAAASVAGIIGTRENRFDTSYASGIALTGVLIATLIVSAGGLFVTAERIYDNVVLTRASVQMRQGDIDRAEKLVARATLFIDDGRAAQLATAVQTKRVSSLLNTELESTDETRQEVQDAIAKMITSAREVVSHNIRDYRAWVQLGDLYTQLGSLGIDGAYEAAIQAYQEARSRNPLNPIATLRVAQVAVVQQDYETAQAFIEEALRLKSDYTDAYYLLSRMAIAQDKTDEAIAATERAVLLQPDNAGLLFQLGVLHYSQQRYEKVIPVLERAVAINPNYSNALYFLGLAYDRLGNTDGALAAFKRVASLNPDNEQIKKIVVALESGKSAFTVLEAGTPNIRENSTLPVRYTAPTQTQ